MWTVFNFTWTRQKKRKFSAYIALNNWPIQTDYITRKRWKCELINTCWKFAHSFVCPNKKLSYFNPHWVSIWLFFFFFFLRWQSSLFWIPYNNSPVTLSVGKPKPVTTVQERHCNHDNWMEQKTRGGHFSPLNFLGQWGSTLTATHRECWLYTNTVTLHFLKVMTGRQADIPMLTVCLNKPRYDLCGWLSVKNQFPICPSK